MIDKVKVIRLPAGEELMGRLVSENDYEIVLKDTHMVHTKWETNGSVNFGMSPFMVYAQKQISFHKSSITAMADVEPGLEKEYLSRTSGIILS